ncbi:MAG: response regulator [Spirochaetaceae bacterium]|nr:MAG: response regulator [Spirochaetaceae bacterium]
MKGTLRVLVVDDEEGVREGMRRVLERSDYKVDLAANGEEAINLLKAHFYDLALIDLKMPGIDGFEVTRYINETLGRQTVVVIVSALATVEAAMEVTRQGAFDFLVKPFNPKDLQGVVERAVRQRTLILEREKYLTELASERNLSHQLINSMHEGIIVLNINREPVLMNPKAESFLSVHYSPQLTLQQLSLSGETLRFIDDVLSSGSPKEETRVRWEKVGERMLEIRVNPYLREGESNGVLIILDDVTRQWQIEQDKTRFISMVAHELKSPIAAILNYVNIILTGMFDDQVEKIHEMMERSKIRGEALLDLIRDLLFLNQSDAGKVEKSIERLELKRILREQLEFFQAQADRSGIKVSLEAQDLEYPVRADRKDLDRIYMNLISNGLKYNREGGTLTLSLQQDEQAVVVRVRDTGIGMSAPEIKGLFEEFYRVKNPHTSGIPGTGLGLATVKRILDEYNGTIRVDSEPSKGSTFTVTLPRG